MRKSVEQSRRNLRRPPQKRPFSATKITVGVIVLLLLVWSLGTIGFATPGLFQSAATSPAATSHKKASPPTIAIGSDSFAALTQNYFDDDSLWRLVNKQNPLHDTEYTPTDLRVVDLATRAGMTAQDHELRQIAIAPLSDLFAAATKDGHPLMLSSAFRSAQTQTQLFDNYAAEGGQTYAENYAALPGQSEHQLGLAVDINTYNVSCMTNCALSVGDADWLNQHAHEYGFIHRYPDDKQSITGYHSESWHYRYVGIALATALWRQNLVLEQVQPQLTTATIDMITKGVVSL